MFPGPISRLSPTPKGRTHEIRLGVFRSNTRTHHKKQKLTPDQMREATDIGLLA
ncbi:helicase associated domain-containing protein [Streptomyces albus]|uniref:helicase associated domain-containing protein n=1 Tax=Streptomyces albus TaxID=1888 RepID=UPI0033CA8F32